MPIHPDALLHATTGVLPDISISHPIGKLKDAVTYAQNQKAHLCAFLEHGEIEGISE